MNIFSCHAEIGFGPSKHSLLWVPRALLLGKRQTRREADCSPPLDAIIKTDWNDVSTSAHDFVAWNIASTRDNFTFLLSVEQIT
jgi:hypothetical protein